MPPSPPAWRLPRRPDTAPPEPRPTRRFAGTRTGARALEAAFEAARDSHDARERLRAGALDALLTFIPAAAAIAFRVGADGVRTPELALAGPLQRRTLDQVVPQLARLEAIDPFAVRHAEAMGARVMTVGDAGGPAALARTLYGRHLVRHRLRAPLFAYFWDGRDGRIVAGVALLRTAEAPDFDADAARLLGEIQPLLEDALTGQAPAPAGEAPPDACGLTPREQEVAGLVGTGAANAAIALALGMSEATVKTHLTRIYEKCGVRSRTELAARVAECS